MDRAVTFTLALVKSFNLLNVCLYWHDKLRLVHILHSKK